MVQTTLTPRTANKDPPPVGSLLPSRPRASAFRLLSNRPMRQRFRLLFVFSGPSDNDQDADTLRMIVKRFGLDYGLDLAVYERDIVNCDCWDDEEGRPAARCCDRRYTRWGGHRDAVREPCGNIARDETFDLLLQECHDGRYDALVAPVPRGGFLPPSGVLFDRAVRERDHPLGMPRSQLDAAARMRLATSNKLAARALTLGAAVFAVGGEIMYISDADRGELGLWSVSKSGRLDPAHASASDHPRGAAKHAPISRLPFAMALDQATGASRVDFAACRLGASLQGYATVMVSGGFAPKAAAHLTSLNGAFCTCAGTHVCPRPEEGRLPAELSKAIARTFLHQARVWQSLEATRPAADAPLRASGEELARRAAALAPFWALIHSPVRTSPRRLPFEAARRDRLAEAHVSSREARRVRWPIRRGAASDGSAPLVSRPRRALRPLCARAMPQPAAPRTAPWRWRGLVLNRLWRRCGGWHQ